MNIRKMKYISKLKSKIRSDFKNEDGHYVVEASIVLPIFLIGIITIGSILNVFRIYENFVYSSVDESRFAMINSYIADDYLMPVRLEKRLKEENKNITNVDVKRFVIGYDKAGQNNLASFVFSYDMDVKAPLPVLNDISKSKKILFRKFVGDKDECKGFTFDRMEREEDSNLVYVFSKDGEKYHKKECSYVEPKVTEVVLTNQVKKKYVSCETCRTNNAKNGTLVYLFLEFGDAYHYKDCSMVTKKYTQIDRQLAQKKGYTPCSKCGG